MSHKNTNQVYITGSRGRRTKGWTDQTTG